MKSNFKWLVVVLCLVCLSLTACSQAAIVSASDSKPIKIVHNEDAIEPTQETLTEQAVQRLDIQTASVRQDDPENGVARMIVPYASVLYDTEGSTWVYTNPAPQTYTRHLVKVDEIEGDDAILSSDDLVVGSLVVTTGAEELYGAEFEFQEE